LKPPSLHSGREKLIGRHSQAQDLEVGSLIALGARLISIPPTAAGVAELCDVEDGLLMDSSNVNSGEIDASEKVGGSLPESGPVRKVSVWLTKQARKSRLEMLLVSDRGAYLETVRFLGARLSRSELPNRQDLGIASVASSVRADGLVDNCALANVTATPSPLDAALLWVFRKKVQEEIGWASTTAGLDGLVEEGRYYMLRATPEVEEGGHFP
jgi:hypothetical protein